MTQGLFKMSALAAAVLTRTAVCHQRCSKATPALMHLAPPDLGVSPVPLQASADGPTWCWWLISMLPLEPSFQLSLFSCTSLRARLSQLQHILTALLQQPPPRHLLPERSPRGRV